MQKKGSYFTLDCNSCGIGDYTTRFRIGYILGKYHLGLTYLHNFKWEMQKKHINWKDTVNDFLGLGIDELDLDNNKFAGMRKTHIDLEKFDKSAVPLESVKKYVRQFEKRNVIFVVIVPCLHYCLSFHKLLNEEYNDIFVYKYWERRKTHYIDIPFNEDKINIVLHIRRSDVSLIKVRDKIINTYWRSTKIFNNWDEAIQYANVHNDGRPYIEIEKYDEILEQVVDICGEDNVCICVFSDGYASQAKINNMKWFDLIKDALGTTKEECIQLLKEYEKKEFEIFNKYKNIHLYIGETEEFLYKAIHSIAAADILIRGGIGVFANCGKMARRKGPLKDLKLSDTDEQMQKQLDEIKKKYRPL